MGCRVLGDDPKAEATLFETGFDAIDERITLTSRERGRQELHDFRIRIEACEREAVGVTPTA